MIEIIRARETVGETVNRYIHTRLFEHKTELCHIMNSHGSDKGSGHHNYSSLYHELFSPIRDTALHVFEVGLGTQDTSIPCHMGVGTTPCSSVRGWRDYFRVANIYGADIDKSILIQEERISTFYCDQTDPPTIADMWNKMPYEFDVIIDDGLHEFHANKIFYENSHHKLRSGGIYIIEDVNTNMVKEFAKYFSAEKDKNKFSDAYVVMIPNPRNHGDNNLVVIQK